MTMTAAEPRSAVLPAAPAAKPIETARALWFALRNEHGNANATVGEQARQLIRQQLALAAQRDDDLPPSLSALPAWSEARSGTVAAQYASYRAARARGEGRRYFSCRAHALHFLRAVAPTKLVDGAWLQGLPVHWRDDRLRPLIATYLEELGEGEAEQNHVAIYRRLLARHGCDDWGSLPDDHFLQGALQLALGTQAESFLPEIIGFNLGYEQLPLHLLITAYELAELAIDPRYFTLHITIDNRASGHARDALRAVTACAPQLGDGEAFYRRLRLGYRLNDVGLGSTALIAGFDLQAEVEQMLARKCPAGRAVHADRCRLGGRNVNDWLSQPAQMPAFLQALQRQGWVQRHRPPVQSRFWQLVQGSGAMFGVFSHWELQLLHDWIAGDALDQAPALPVARGAAITALEPPTAAQRGMTEGGSVIDFNGDLAALEQQLRPLDRAAQLDRLVPLLGAGRHHTVPGLMATRLFCRLLAQS